MESPTGMGNTAAAVDSPFRLEPGKWSVKFLEALEALERWTTVAASLDLGPHGAAVQISDRRQKNGLTVVVVARSSN